MSTSRHPSELQLRPQPLHTTTRRSNISPSTSNMYRTEPGWLPSPSTPPPSPAATPQENPFDNLPKPGAMPLSANEDVPHLVTPSCSAILLRENEEHQNIVSDWVEAVSARLSRLPAIEPDDRDPANYTGNQRLEALGFKILPWDLVMADNAQGKPQLYYPVPDLMPWAFDEGPDPGNPKHEFFLQLMVKLSKKPPPTPHLGYQVFGFKTTLMAPEEWPEYGVLIHQIPEDVLYNKACHDMVHRQAYLPRL